MDIVQLIISQYKDMEMETNNGNINELYEDANNIKHCVNLLRSNISDGPKKFWKIESHFFNKIDNYLSVLVCGENIQDLYLQCFPDFLYEEKVISHDMDGIMDDIPSYNPPLSIQRYRNSYNLMTVNYGPSSNLKMTNSTSDMNAFHAIQHRIARSYKSNIYKSQNNLSKSIVTDRKWEQDIIDTLTDKCCDNGCCVEYDCMTDYIQCVHNLDRVYIKMACLIIIAMLFGCLFITSYYYKHGKIQADDALFLSLEAIGDRAAGLMNEEFWVPQMAISLTIGGLTTGDLLPNASLYTAPNYKFDQFFASFATVQHTTAIFSVFMYNHQLNTMIGAYQEPDMNQLDGHDNSSIIIMYYNGTCRKDRLYDPILRTRVEAVPFARDSNRNLENYNKCNFDPTRRKWYTKGEEIGVGKSEWTEPYIFAEGFQGMSYVTPIIWNQQNLTFVVEVTTHTLAVAVSREIQNLPGGDDPYTVWMIVTSGINAVASSTNETLIDIPGCKPVYCQTDNPKIIAGIDYMKNNNFTDNVRFTTLNIDSNYQLSVYPFYINHVNLHPQPPYTSNEWIVRPIDLASTTDYQYGYVAIVNDGTYLYDVNNAWRICWIITVLSISSVVILIVCNIRYSNIEQNKLGRAGRSGIIRTTESKRLRIAQSSIHSFTKQISKSRSFSNGDISGSDNGDVSSPMYANSTLNGNKTVRINMPVIGDRLKTKNNTCGIVAFIGQLNSISPQTNIYDPNRYILLEQDNHKGQILIQLGDVIYNFGQKDSDHKSEESPSPIPIMSLLPIQQIPISSHSRIDNKILTDSLTPLKAGAESDEESDEDSDVEDSLTDETIPVAGTLQSASPIPSSVQSMKQSNGSKTKPYVKLKLVQSAPVKAQIKSTLSKNPIIIENEESKEEVSMEVPMRCFCIKQQQFENMDSKCELFCYIPQKTLICVSYLLLCVTLLVLVLVWEFLTTEATMTLFDDVLAKHEWLTIQDQVYHLFDTTDMIGDIVSDRFYRNDMDLTNSKSLDRFFLNVMQSFVHPWGEYKQWYIYIATPNGNMRGAKWVDLPNNKTGLAAGIRNDNTNRSYNAYDISERTGYHMISSLAEDPNPIYDPRCRPWYLDTLRYSFTGTNDQAFPNGTYFEWRDEMTSSANCGKVPSNCEDNVKAYNSMWNITNITKPWQWENNTYKYNGTHHSMVWTRYLFASSSHPQISLTGSRTIINPQTGELLAIIAVDYFISEMSETLRKTVENPHDYQSQVSYDNWRAWIFEVEEQHAIIAASDGNVLRDTKETEGCYGFLVSVENQKVPYNAKEHPEKVIRVNSKEIIDVYGIDSLYVNKSTSQKIKVPEGLPTLEAGIVQYYPGSEYSGGQASVNWVILKTIDVTGSFVDDFHITMVFGILILACVWVLLKQLDYSDKLKNKHTNKNKRNKNKEDNKDADDYKSIMNKMKPIVAGSAKAIWTRLMTHNKSKLNSIGCASIITTEQAKTFLANRANNHIASENENNAVFRECAWYACAYERYWKRVQLKYWEFIESNYYDIPIQLLLLGHLAVTFWEPATPNELKEQGLTKQMLIVLSVAQFIQWLDCILVGMKRYFEFMVKEPYLTSLYELNYGFNHKYTQLIKYSGDKYKNSKMRSLYLVFMGPQSRRYIFHIILVSIDLINFILQITIRVAPFSYYIPILPLLIIVRNHHVLIFGYDFISAIIYAKEVLFSYFCFILVFAILTISLFRDTVNYDQFADSFQTISNAVITGFVFVSTSENYALTYDIFDSKYYASTTQHWLILGNVVCITIFFAMMGMFCWIPMIIDKFEQAFEESNMRHDQKNKLRKTNAIIAAFVMLDFNTDMGIDSNEFDCLVTSSVLIDKSQYKDLFDKFDRNNNNTLDIYEFVSCLLKQSFRTKIMSTSSHIPQLKFNSYFECNIFRHREYTIYIFVFLVVPVIALSMIRGLTHRFDEGEIDQYIILFSCVNMFEIHFRWLCFGIKRFWDLLKYPNPNYVIAAINKYNTNSNKYRKRITMTMYDNVNSSNTIRLTSNEREWVKNNLKPVRPLSILEKSTQTLINRIELIMFWFALIAIVAHEIVFELQNKNNPPKTREMYGSNEDISNATMNERYLLYFIQLAVMTRIFTLIPANQKLLYIIFKVFPSFIALFVFLGLYIYAWARIGCTLFGDGKTEIVIPEIYEPAEDMVANFNTLSYAILALIQLMIGEGWHEVMYYNIIATSQFTAAYFIIYITIVSIIIANVFVGLFLADIDEVTQQQSHDEIIKHSAKLKSFKVFASEKLNKLNYQIKQNVYQNSLMIKQMEHINYILLQQEVITKESSNSNIFSQ